MTDPQSLVERLAGEAGEYASQQGHHAHGMKWFEARDAKFAELVARECMKPAEYRALPSHAERLSSEGWTVAETNAASAIAEGIAFDIRQRFWVGE